MKFVGFFVAFLLVFGCFGSSAFSSDEITPEQVQSLAEAEKEKFFGLISIEYLKKYGNPVKVQTSPKVSYPDLRTLILKEDKKKLSLELDQPFLIHTVSREDILNYRDGDDLSSVLKPTDEWIVPLNIAGKAHAYISVGFSEGKWKAVGISMGDFGENLRKSVPSEFMPGKVKGGKYVRIYTAHTDFVAVGDGGETKMMPLTHSMHAFSSAGNTKDSRGLYRASDIMPKIADSIRAADMRY